MSTIDERIVAMRFDNAQFEKGVKQSMRSIEELKEATNFEGVGEGLSEFSSKIGKELNFSATAKSTSMLSKSLGVLQRTAGKAFSASTWPLKALGQSLQEIGRYTQMVFGIDVASSLVNAGKTAVQELLVKPIASGFQEYELKMDSIKTIMTGSGESLETVKETLEELNLYADKTIYSFSDMTSNIGKFTNAGVKLNVATTAIKGVANAAAHAGQGSAEASRAMYNLSQALGMGYLGTRDWMSIENANMATQTFKKTLIEMGVAMGTLEKKGDKYFVKGAKDVEVTAENLRDTLQKKWVNNDVLLAALGIYGDDPEGMNVEKIMEKYNIADREVAQTLLDIMIEANKAATEVRTFSKMWDALKEAAQSGWGVSFELIFGDMEEATQLWTGLNDKISAVLDAKADARNDLLRQWRGMQKNEEGVWEKVEGAEDGRAILIEGFYTLFDSFQALGSLFGMGFSDVFGSLTPDRLMELTKGFSNLTKKFKDWIGQTSNAKKLRSISSGFFSFFNVFKTTISGVWNTVSTALHLDKVGELILSVAARVGEWFTSINEPIANFWEEVSQSKTVQDISEWFGNLWDTLIKFVDYKDDGSSVDFVASAKNVFEKLKSLWAEIQASDVYKGITDFFTNIWDFFTKKKPPEVKDKDFLKKENNSYIYSMDADGLTEKVKYAKPVTSKDAGKTGFQETVEAIVEWLGSISPTITAKWNEFKALPFWTELSGFFTSLWSDIQGTDVYKSFTTFLSDAKKQTEEFFTAKDEKTNKTGFWTAVDNAFNDISTVLTSIKNSEVWDWFTSTASSLITSVHDFFVKVDEASGKTGFTTFIDNVLAGITNLSETITGTTLYKEASDLLSGFASTLLAFLIPSAKTEESEVSSKKQENKNALEATATEVEKAWSEAKPRIDSVSAEATAAVEKIKNLPSKLDSSEESTAKSTTFKQVSSAVTSDWDSNKEAITQVKTEAERKMDDIKKLPDEMNEPVNTAPVSNWFQDFSASGFIEGWNKVSTSISDLATNISETVTKISSAVDSFTTFIASTDWNDIITKAEQHLSSFANIFVVFGTGRALSGAGSLFSGFGGVGKGAGTLLSNLGEAAKNFGNQAQTIGEATAETIKGAGKNLGSFFEGIKESFSFSRKIEGASNAALKFAEAVGVFVLDIIILAAAIQMIDPKHLDKALQIILDVSLILAIVAVASFYAGATSDKIGKSALYFAAGIALIVRAIKQIASAEKEGTNFDAAFTVLDKIGLIIGLFVAVASMEGSAYLLGGGQYTVSFSKNKKSGLIGFAIAIWDLVNQVQELAKFEKDNPGALEKAIPVLDHLAIIIGLFTALSGADLSKTLKGTLLTGNFETTRNLSLGKNSSFTNLIGFANAIAEMVRALGKLGEMDPAKAEKGIALLDKIVALIDKFTILSNIFGSSFSTKGFNLNLGGNSQFKNLIGFVLAIKGLVLSLAALELLSALDSKGIDHASDILQKLGDMIDKFLLFKGLNDLLGSLNDDKKSGLLGFVVSLAGMIAEIAVIADLDPTKTEGAVKTMQALTDMIAEFKVVSGVQDLASGIGSAIGDVTTGSKVLGLASMALFVAALGALLWGLSELAKQDFSTEKLTALTDTFASITTSLSVFVPVVTTFVAGLGLLPFSVILKGIAGLAVITLGIGLIGLAMWGLEEALEGIFGEDAATEIPKKIKRFAAVIKSVTDAVAEIAGSFVGTAIGSAEGSNLGETMAAVSEHADEIDQDKLRHLQKSVGIFREISASLKGFDPTLWGKLFNGDITIGQFSLYMKELADGIQTYSTKVKDIENWDEIERANEMVLNLSRILALAGLNSSVTLGVNDLDAIFNGGYMTEDGLYNLSVFYQTMGEALANGMNKVDFDPTSLIDTICEGIKSGKERIQNTFREVFREALEGQTVGEAAVPEISGSANGEELKKGFASVYEKMQKYGIEMGDLFSGDADINAHLVDDGTGNSEWESVAGALLGDSFKIDSESFSSIVSAVNTNGSNIVSAINSLGSRIDAVADAVANMQIVLNTGVIAGAVDANLGYKAFLAGRVLVPKGGVGR